MFEESVFSVSVFLNLYLSLYIVFSGPLFVVFWLLNSVLRFTASDWPNDIFKPVFSLSRQEQVITIKHVGSRWSLDKAMGLWLFFLLLLWKGETMHRSGEVCFSMSHQGSFLTKCFIMKSCFSVSFTCKSRVILETQRTHLCSIVRRDVSLEKKLGPSNKPPRFLCGGSISYHDR